MFEGPLLTLLLGLDLIPEYAANNTCFFFDDQGLILEAGALHPSGNIWRKQGNHA